MTKDQTRLIVGLGNPGKEYEDTRHNLGYLVVEYLAKSHNLCFRKSSFINGLIAEGKESDICCLLPSTYMNNSGVAVNQAALGMKVDSADILIVCDDLHLSFGQIRIRSKGSAGGHNGLVSIVEHLGKQDFARLRLGIGMPFCRRQTTVDYVLGKWTPQEKKDLDAFIIRAADCCMMWAQEGILKAMDQFNKVEMKK